MRTTATALVVATALVAAALVAQTPAYVGAAKCAICHKTEKQGQQHPLWQAGKHSKSFEALSTPAALKLAADASANPKCLKCHSPLAGKAAELKAEGVTCEVCHGPGSEYKKLSVMKNREEAVKAGLVVYADEAAIKNQCLTCHEDAHDKPFVFAAAWAKVKHNIPK